MRRANIFALADESKAERHWIAGGKNRDRQEHVCTQLYQVSPNRQLTVWVTSLIGLQQPTLRQLHGHRGNLISHSPHSCWEKINYQSETVIMPERGGCESHRFPVPP